ncbi:MAG: dipicolinate synthase subunit DpsA [Clostridia bacterium]|nr:dipicolinate synthase subunit DpsA [Clostridia bacterium]MDH7572366.1 dipicolinate synthase subunit DpsA [Clostridia bacterium]
MQSRLLANLTVSVVGGDDRELILIPALVDHGASVRVVGFPGLSFRGAVAMADLQAAVQGAHVVIFPTPGTDERGAVHAVYSPSPLLLNEETASRISPGTVVIIGQARPFFQQWALRYGWKLVETAREDEVAILNSIPTAEGAIQLAMQELPITIHGCRALVLGFGRVGQTLAGDLLGLGARVAAADRSPAALARAFAIGCRPVPMAFLADEVADTDVIFNTVPAPVLNARLLARVSSQSLIIDLASPPGGTDFETASRLGIKARLAPGLPGKVAPRTAGDILARVIPRLIRQHLGLDPLPEDQWGGATRASAGG